jgi:hypothetical protein
VRSVFRSLVLAASVLALAPSASAQGAPAAATPPPPGGESPKRARPDYDGRGGEPTTAGDVLIWVPRVVFFPLYLVSEFVIRRPLGWLITTAEQKQWPSAIRDFLTFGPDKKTGFVPAFFVDFGFRPSFGLYFFSDDVLAPGHDIRAHVSTFGPDWLQGSLASRSRIDGKDATVDLKIEGAHRPDQIFHGIGPRTLMSDRARYGIDRVSGGPQFDVTWWRGSRMRFAAGMKYVNFREDACCDNQSVDAALRAGRIAAPPGYLEGGYTSVYERGELTIDSRRPRPEPGGGYRVELEVEHGAQLDRAQSAWVRYGGGVGGYLDLSQHYRVVSLSLHTYFADPIGGGALPFTEHVVLGGSGLMRGFLYGRVHDRSAAVATLRYRWPIWVFLDGSAQVQMGNGFGPLLRDFDPGLFRLSAAIGVETVGSPDHTFEVLFGLGTETFDQGASVNSVRFLFGTNRGF